MNANPKIRVIGNFPRRTPMRNCPVRFKIPYAYDFLHKIEQEANKSLTESRVLKC